MVAEKQTAKAILAELMKCPDLVKASQDTDHARKVYLQRAKTFAETPSATNYTSMEAAALHLQNKFNSYNELYEREYSKIMQELYTV